MTSSLNTLLDTLKTDPDSVTFDAVQTVISEHYHYTPAAFNNGHGDDCVRNDAGTNEGSCKILAFAKINFFSDSQALACFGHYYREHVLGNPDGNDHANIRTLMRHGLSNVTFDTPPLAAK